MTGLIGLLISSTVAIALLVPLHHWATTVIALPPLPADGRFTLDLESAQALRGGQTVPLYRYHEQFPIELGRARVVAIEAPVVHLQIIADSFLFPPGRQGRVVGREGALLQLELLPSQGFGASERVNLFDRSRRIGVAEIIEPAAQPVRARLVQLDSAHRDRADLTGLVVSEYTVQTNLVFLSRPWVSWLEVFVMLAIAVVDLWIFSRRGHGLAAGTGLAIKGLIQRVPAPVAQRFRSGAIIMLGLPICYFAGHFAYRLVESTTGLRQAAGGASTAWLGSLVLFVIYLHRFRSTRVFPPLLLWNALAYVPRRRLGRIVRSEPAQKHIIWSLQLVIAFFFAFALIGFLSANVNGALQYLVPKPAVLDLQAASLTDPASLWRWAAATGANVRLLVAGTSASLTFDQALRTGSLLLNAVTIVGCLVGYLHSVLKVGRFSAIRNVDFTVAGWLTNAICYGPLLGGLAWSIVPTLWGTQPVVANGPLWVVMVMMGITFNLLYTLSILNMSTRFGVMVDKGLVRHGFFGVIRHPNYTLESFMFVLMAMRGCESLSNWIGAGFIVLIYWLRSEREEVFMRASNPDYAGYAGEVKYKYIPGLL